MNRFEYLMLSILERAGSCSPASAMTVREITETEDYGYRENTIYKKLREFEMEGHVGKGFKDGRADTFYITDTGRDLLIAVRGK